MRARCREKRRIGEKNESREEDESPLPEILQFLI